MPRAHRALVIDDPLGVDRAQFLEDREPRRVVGRDGAHLDRERHRKASLLDHLQHAPHGKCIVDGRMKNSIHQTSQAIFGVAPIFALSEAIAWAVDGEI